MASAKAWERPEGEEAMQEGLSVGAAGRGGVGGPVLGVPQLQGGWVVLG